MLPNGGRSGFDLSSGTGTNYYNNSRLAYQTDGSGTVTNLTLTYPDGRKMDYGQTVDGIYFYMTKSSDPDTNALSFQYDVPYPWTTPRLKYVVDQDGKTNTLNYTGDSFLVDSVDGPYGTVTLQYDASEHLTNITDVVGIESSFTYDINDWPQTLTTPYGTTTFSVEDIVSGRPDRTATIEDPINHRHAQGCRMTV